MFCPCCVVYSRGDFQGWICDLTRQKSLFGMGVLLNTDVLQLNSSCILELKRTEELLRKKGQAFQTEKNLNRHSSRE